MGGTLSKSRTFTPTFKDKPDSTHFSSSTTSSDKTIVGTPYLKDGALNKRSDLHYRKSKSSILPNNNFFDNILQKKKVHNNKNEQDGYQRDRPKTHNSLSKRRKAKPLHKKRKAVLVTKSIIGKPTNFKHLNSSTTQFNQINFLEAADEEATKVAAQMMILSALIKPLSTNNEGTCDLIPVLPPRTSSCGNPEYMKNIFTPTHYKATMATPSLKKNKRKTSGLKSRSIPRTSVAKKRV